MNCSHNAHAVHLAGPTTRARLSDNLVSARCQSCWQCCYALIRLFKASGSHRRLGRLSSCCQLEPARACAAFAAARCAPAQLSPRRGRCLSFIHLTGPKKLYLKVRFWRRSQASTALRIAHPGLFCISTSFKRSCPKLLGRCWPQPWMNRSARTLHIKTRIWRRQITISHAFPLLELCRVSGRACAPAHHSRAGLCHELLLLARSDQHRERHCVRGGLYHSGHETVSVYVPESCMTSS